MQKHKLKIQITKYKIQNIKQNHIGTQIPKIKISNYNINHTQDPTKDAPIIAVIILPLYHHHL